MPMTTSSEDYEHCCSLVSALACHREQFGNKVLDLLKEPDECTGWLEVVLVQLAGEMKLEAATASLAKLLEDPA